MADKIPLKGLFDAGGNVTGLAEFRSADGDTLGVIHGGTGLATIGTNRILTGNGTGDLTDEANLTFDGTTLAVTGDTTISGNLTVQGNFTETVKIATEDPIIALNTAVTGSNTYDSGFVTERGSDTNVALIWDESEDLFNFITTTDTGVVSGNVNVSGQANIKTGDITSTGNLAISGTLTGVTSLTMNGALSGITNLGLSGNLQFDSGQVIDGILIDTVGHADQAFVTATASETKLVTEKAVKTHVSAQASAFAIALG
jgi:uncharacterized Zn-binding protein involved in type VI secretion